mgnify:CR=1 FL=1
MDQILKRSFGRESPSARTSSRGTFRPFPNLRTYQKHVSKYDAMPSGHIMSATLGWTIIIENYPEYKPILLPIAVTWLTILGLQMINIEVHWASDYPLGIGIGYLIAKSSTRLGKIQSNSVQTNSSENWQLFPMLTGNGLGIGLVHQF